MEGLGLPSPDAEASAEIPVVDTETMWEGAEADVRTLRAAGEHAIHQGEPKPGIPHQPNNEV